uniref:Capsid protein n=1 Tax=Riboviria sp. TaxID=2585031 RepID=A0A514DCL7_9VIRU|nr:MAG: hypothetical protein H4Rhizo431567_000001 [Riboviria sp.]
MTTTKTKKRQSVKNVTKKMQKMQVAKKPKPFRAAGEIIGDRVGQMFNMPMLKGLGRWLGSGIGSIFGSGDYTMVGPSPNYNVLASSNNIPKFSTTHATNIVCHREYLMDISGTAAFNNIQFPINPGQQTTFPWLSTIAANYQQYKFHGLIFEFRPLITDFVTSGAPGVVIMATNYNSDVPAYVNKQQMENSEYAVSVKPTRELIHGVECDVTQTVLTELYVRTGSLPTGQDLRLCDLGLFQFATQSNPVQNLGELWVSYCVEFFKPVLGPISGSGGHHVFKTSVSAGNPMGLIGVTNVGDLNVTTTNTALSWTAQAGINYMVNVIWLGAANACTMPSVTLTGLVGVTYLNGTAGSSQFAPNPSVSSQTLLYDTIVKSTSLGPATVTITFGTGGSLPIGAPVVDVIISAMSENITS